MKLRKKFIVTVDGEVMDKDDINKDSLLNVIQIGHPDVEAKAITVKRLYWVHD